jgi:hypothetical protein
MCAALVAFITVASSGSGQQSTGSTGELTGSVQAAGQPIAGATVTLYAAAAAAPVKLAEVKTDDQGAFKLDAGPATRETVLYLVAKGGTPKAAESKGANDAIALLAVLGSTPPKIVTVNELTTVASAFTAARFINGEAISGNPLGLRIAAGNVPQSGGSGHRHLGQGGSGSTQQHTDHDASDPGHA